MMKGISVTVLQRAREKRDRARNLAGRPPAREEIGFQIAAYPKISTVETLFADGMSPGAALDIFAETLTARTPEEAVNAFREHVLTIFERRAILSVRDTQ